MERHKIIQIQTKLKQFLDGKEKLFSFDITGEPKDRIKSIYQIIFPKFQKIRFYVVFLLARIAQYIDYSPIKVGLYRLIGVKIGKGVFISPDVIVDPHFPSLIEIEDYSILGWGVKLFTHEFSGSTYRIGRINIQDGAVVGAYVTIRGGVTVGKMSEIPYGSIVNKDVPANSKARQVLIRQ